MGRIVPTDVGLLIVTVPIRKPDIVGSVCDYVFPEICSSHSCRTGALCALHITQYGGIMFAFALPALGALIKMRVPILEPVDFTAAYIAAGDYSP